MFGTIELNEQRCYMISWSTVAKPMLEIIAMNDSAGYEERKGAMSWARCLSKLM